MIIVLSLLWFAWFASCIQYSACFTWTKYPDSITRVWNGSTVALRWDYNLSTAEQSAAALLVTRIWRRGNESHLLHIATKDFNVNNQPTKYVEDLKPHITISRSEEATLIINDVTKEDEALYKFTFNLLTLNNFLIARNTTLLVAVQPTLQCQSSLSVIKGEQATVLCNVTGDPKPNITWTKVSEPGNIISYNSTLVIDNVRISDGGKYNVTAYNGRSASELVTLNITYQPENVRLTTNTTSEVCTGVVINFTCTAEANPAVHTYLLYENDTMIENMGISGTWIKTMENAGQFVFRCEANNSVQGIGKSNDTILTVDVPAFLEQAKNKVVGKEGESVEVYCNVTAGIPEPTVIWRKVKTGEPIPTERNLLNITNITREQAGNYSCTANNTCGEASTVVEIDVQYPPTIISKNRTKDVPEGRPVSISCPVRGNPQPNITWYKGNETLPSTVINTNSTLEFPVTVLNDSGWYTCFAENFLGNVTVTVQLRVAKRVPSTPSTSSKPTTEAKLVPSTPSTSSKPTAEESVCNEFFKKEDCSINWVILVIIAVVGVIVISAIVGAIGWWVHKRRKCRKDTRVHSSASEEQPFSRENSTPSDDNPYSQVNNGYAQAGPRPSEMTDMEQHQGTSDPATVPNYAVVDKSAKKGHKKDKKVEEQKPAVEPPQYTVVDKSKKKKKGEPEATYAQVDMSKKSKKKPKPGEVLYADLGDFHQMQELPAVATSPQALPPIKKPAPYVETQYADITQFLKGDATLPDSNNSQGPATGTQAAPVPESNNSQEPATSTKEESQASNTGGDGGPGHETNF